MTRSSKVGQFKIFVMRPKLVRLAARVFMRPNASDHDVKTRGIQRPLLELGMRKGVWLWFLTSAHEVAPAIWQGLGRVGNQFAGIDVHSAPAQYVDIGVVGFNNAIEKSGDAWSAGLAVRHGGLRLTSVRLPWLGAKAQARVGGKAVALGKAESGSIEFAEQLSLKAGDKLEITS